MNNGKAASSPPVPVACCARVSEGRAHVLEPPTRLEKVDMLLPPSSLQPTTEPDMP